MVMNLITAPPLLIRARRDLLLLPGIPDAVHPLQKHFNLLAVSLSGQLSEIKKFKRTLGHLSVAHGETVQDPGMTLLCANGCHIVQNNLLIPVIQI